MGVLNLERQDEFLLRVLFCQLQLVRQLLADDRQELRENDGALSVLIHLVDHVIQLCFRGVQPQA